MYISMSDINVDHNLQPDHISMLIQSSFAIWAVRMLCLDIIVSVSSDLK